MHDPPGRCDSVLAALLCAVLAVGLVACRNTTRLPPSWNDAHGKPPQWSQVTDEPGLRNFRRVSDDLFCGAQPTAKGIRRLSEIGIKSVLNLRTGNERGPNDEAVALRHFFIPMSAWDARDEQVIEFLRLVNDRDNLPMFVHCQHGSDRTGLLCAMYRVAVQGWTKEQAIDEMTRGGFGFNSLCAGLVEYIRDANVEDLRRQAGMSVEPVVSSMATP
ncbi:MAG: dual specificity protein phosphatase family protein [Phycisphaerales bacterium]|nr:dual specificity protein phosphatase family protein [Phycisphaerales bacterium]